MPEDRLLTVPEVAGRLCVNPELVRRSLRQGRLWGALLGGTRSGYRLYEGEMQRFITTGGKRQPTGEGEAERASA